MGQEDKDTFSLPEGFGAEIPEYRKLALFFVDGMIFNLIARGLSQDEAHSMVAHFLLDAAYGTAFVGALAGGRTPNPDRFIEAAQDAVSRLDVQATTKLFREANANGNEAI